MIMFIIIIMLTFKVNFNSLIKSLDIIQINEKKQVILKEKLKLHQKH